MNEATTISELKKQLSSRDLEIKHLNAVNQELQDMLTEVKQLGRNSSDAAGSAQIHLSHANAQLAVLRRDMVRLRPDYDLSKLGDARSDMYNEQTSAQLGRILLETDNPAAWQLIENNPALVVDNLLDSRSGLFAELKTALANFAGRDSISLMQVIEKSAVDILARGEA